MIYSWASLLISVPAAWPSYGSKLGLEIDGMMRKAVSVLTQSVLLLRQADLLAKSFHAWIAAKQGEFGICERPAYPNRPRRSGAIQSFQSAVLVAQTGEDRGLVEWVSRTGGCQFLRLLAPAGPRIGLAERAPNLSTR